MRGAAGAFPVGQVQEVAPPGAPAATARRRSGGSTSGALPAGRSSALPKGVAMERELAQLRNALRGEKERRRNAVLKGRPPSAEAAVQRDQQRAKAPAPHPPPPRPAGDGSPAVTSPPRPCGTVAASKPAAAAGADGAAPLSAEAQETLARIADFDLFGSLGMSAEWDSPPPSGRAAPPPAAGAAAAALRQRGRPPLRPPASASAEAAPAAAPSCDAAAATVGDSAAPPSPAATPPAAAGGSGGGAERTALDALFELQATRRQHALDREATMRGEESPQPVEVQCAERRGGELLEGALDERANRRDFLEALAAWRRGAAAGPSGPAATAAAIAAADARPPSAAGPSRTEGRPSSAAERPRTEAAVRGAVLCPVLSEDFMVALRSATAYTYFEHLRACHSRRMQAADSPFGFGSR
eukprot:TRINITY_DN10435_c0_g1_i1.p1 TRINITY_DN10435_c0_g1~~TRINITY_DN10435_c0_g1_i1.p1  ORF type:complete len:441 (+),score=94.55 TRINITY_DN10435_c0_g1_i1:83-1324(+)